MSSQPVRGYLVIAATIVIAGVLISASLFFAVGQATKTLTSTEIQTSTFTTTATETYISTEFSTTTGGSTTYYSTVSSSGLRLQVTMNSTSVPPHGAVAVQMKVLNTLSKNVSLGVVANQNISAWNRYDYLCGTNPSVSLLGFALLKGDFAAGNVSSAGPPLQLAASSAALMCLANLPLNSTTFLPNSDRTMSSWTYAKVLQPPYPVTAEVNATTGYCFGSDLSGGCHGASGILGYWNASSGSAGDASLASPAFTYLPPGEYTVVAMDDWGQTVYAHFQVTQASTAPDSISLAGFSIATSGVVEPTPYLSGQIYVDAAPGVTWSSYMLYTNGVDCGTRPFNTSTTMNYFAYFFQGAPCGTVTPGATYLITFVVKFTDGMSATASTSVLAN